MTTPTSNMGLLKGQDNDNAEVYLTSSLAAGLDLLDAHDHSGTTKGIAIAAGAIGMTQLAANAATKAAVVSSTTAANTTSTTGANIPDLSLSVTTQGGSVLLIVAGSFYNDTTGNISVLRFAQGGTQIAVAARWAQAVGNSSTAVAGVSLWSPAAGTYTVTAQWLVSAGTLTADTGQPRVLIAIEFRR